jgi:energy-coupling factor transporter ATP-binding protein EcfA2
MNSLRIEDLRQVYDFFSKEISKPELVIQENYCEEYFDWLEKKVSQFQMPTFSRNLSTETDWIPLKARCIKGDLENFNVDFIPDLFHHCLVIGGSGVGKSTLIKRLAFLLLQKEKKILIARVPELIQVWQKGLTFSEAVLGVSVDGFYEHDQSLKLLLKNPDYLLLDGLDESKTHQVSFCQKLIVWAQGHLTTKIILTSRPGLAFENLPGWNSVVIEPLSSENVEALMKKLIINELGNIQYAKNKLARTKEMLRNEATLSLARESPLFVGFMARVLISDLEFNIQNRTDLYKSVMDLAYSHLPQSRESREFKKRNAMRVLEIAGKTLTEQPYLTEDELIDLIICEIERIGFNTQEAEKDTYDGICFWTDKRILICNKIGYKNKIEFSHRSLCDFSAGQYLSKLNEQELETWIYRFIDDESESLRDSIRFACGLGAGEKIIKNLLSLDQSSSLNSRDFLEVIILIKEIGDIPKEIFDYMVYRIESIFQESSPCLIFEYTYALIDICPEAVKLVSSISQRMLKNKKISNRMAAMRLALTCSKEAIDLEDLTQLLKEVTAVRKYSSENISLISLKDKGRNKNYEWKLKNDLIYMGCKTLLEKKKTIAMANFVEEIRKQKKRSANTVIMLERLMFGFVQERINSLDSQKEKKKWYLLKQEMFSEATQGFEFFFGKENLLREIRSLQRKRSADLVFLKSVIRASEFKEQELKVGDRPVELIALGILVKGMGFYDMPTYEWESLVFLDEYESLDVVLKGMILALDIDPSRIAIEAAAAIQDVKLFFSSNLSSIAIDLINENLTEDRVGDLRTSFFEILDNKSSLWIFQQIPRVPANPDWSLASSLELPSEVLVRALKHPSVTVARKAAQLIKHGAGGTEAIELAKKIVGAKEWKDFEELEN